MKSPINRLIQVLKKQNKTLALAESMTCGLAAHQFTKGKGASNVFLGCVVCYNADVKVKLLGLDKKIIEKYSPESQQVTDELARKLSNLLEADICAAITGLASPGGSENEEKPVGTVFFSVLMDNTIHQLKRKFDGEPSEIIKKACDALYEFIIEILTG